MVIVNESDLTSLTLTEENWWAILELVTATRNIFDLKIPKAFDKVDLNIGVVTSQCTITGGSSSLLRPLIIYTKVL